MSAPPEVGYQPLARPAAEMVFRLPGVVSCVRRLRRLGVQGFEVGMCEHGPVVKAQVQVSRNVETLNAHGAGDWVKAMDAIADVIEARRRTKGKR